MITVSLGELPDPDIGGSRSVLCHRNQGLLKKLLSLDLLRQIWRQQCQDLCEIYWVLLLICSSL